MAKTHPMSSKDSKHRLQQSSVRPLPLKSAFVCVCVCVRERGGLRSSRPSLPPLAPSANSMTLKRKKWTEEEERCLIDKYAEMQSEGILARMRTREKKFRPIAAHVNSCHHSLAPSAYPFFWSWKDASTKVQNMRHQYLLVKQKLISTSLSPSSATGESAAGEPDWSQGLSLWPNFLRYRHVFGDAPLPLKPQDPPPSAVLGAVPKLLASATDVDGDMGLGIGFDCSDEDGGFDYEEAAPLPLTPLHQLPLPTDRRKKKKRRRREGREWARIAVALEELREREERLEERERERARQGKEEVEERERERREAWEGERLQRREEEREWEERMEQRRSEWRKRMDVMMGQHQAEMEQIQARVLHEQQAVITQLIGIISHWTASAGNGGIVDIAGMGGGSGTGGQHYVSQMMQGMHHVNGMVPGENRVGGEGPDDQFIVDG